jgi:hypothetical protein|tara:strand:- start:38 stop:325 length:288 start_codon:yes stop_codon:yes gene_type:complete
MKNPSNSVFGVVKDTAGLGVKVTKLGIKALAWSIANAHNVVDFTIDATKEGYSEGRNKKDIETRLREYQEFRDAETGQPELPGMNTDTSLLNRSL